MSIKTWVALPGFNCSLFSGLEIHYESIFHVTMLPWKNPCFGLARGTLVLSPSSVCDQLLSTYLMIKEYHVAVSMVCIYTLKKKTHKFIKQ